MANPIGTLSAKGWVSEMSVKADYLLSYYFTSQYSQSNLYRGGISSLQYHLQMWGNSPSALTNQLPNAIEKYLSGFFDTVSASVKIVDPTSVEDSRMTIQLTVNVTQNGVSASLGRLVSYLNSKIVSIFNMNNGTTQYFNT